jgi:ABC-2 type transport system ATP-binding protein
VADLYEMDRSIADPLGEEWLTRLGLSAFLDERIEQYSHGMKQRLVMAAALFRKPSVLAIDEPMVGLDPHGARLVKGLFRQAADAGSAILLSTHSLAVAEQVCDRAIILHRGRILVEGSVSDLRTRAGMESSALEDVFLALTDVDQDPVGAR